MLFYAFATWGNAGFLREQVCKYMCPYARFQGAMFDRDTLIITYDTDRGDPRGRRGKRDDPRALQLGDCIDCGLCVQVCPTGIDIRDGQQYECIGCAACIDACDQVMDKMGYAKGLVRYDTMNGLANGYDRSTLLRRMIRPRALVYLAIVTAVSVALLGHLALRVPLKVDVIRDRGAMYREVKNGAIENVYRLQIINSAERKRQFLLAVDGLPGAKIDSDPTVSIGAADHRMVPVRVRVPADSGQPGSNSIRFSITATDDPSVSVTESASFLRPRR
jgi:cytochrome c oxidase accessory protein FixG